MRYFYKNKNSDFYSPSIIDNPFIWLIVSLMLFVGSLWLLLKGYTLGGFVQNTATLSMILFIGLLTWQLYQAKRHLGKISRLGSYLLNYDLVQALDTSILNSKGAAAMTNKSYRVLPKIWLWYDHSSTPEWHIKIQKLAGSYETDLDHVAELVSSTVGDHYAVTSKQIDRSGSWYEIVCGLVDEKIRFVPKSIDDLMVQPYDVKLMNNLIIPMNKIPHLAIFGLTSSRKTTVLLTILSEKIGLFDDESGGEACCYFIDGKNEFEPLKSFYPKSHFASEPAEVIELLKRLLLIRKKRAKIINKMVKKRGAMGLTAYDADLKPIYLFVDEFASVKARFDKSKELESLMLRGLMQFRAYGIFILYCSQSPSTQVLSNQMREQFGTYILLGTANADTQRMAFGQVATTGTVPIGSGYYLEKTAETPTPQRFEVPDTHKYKLNTLTVLKQIYRNGERNNAH